MKKIGIYKLTNPLGLIYVGQSKDLIRRKKEHTFLTKKNKQIKLDESYSRFGPEGHLFEVIEECSILELDSKERFWQEKLKTTEIGLNVRLTWIKGLENDNKNNSKEKKEKKDTLKDVLYIRSFVNQKISAKIKEIIDGSKYDNETIAKACGISRMTLFRFSNKSANIDIAFVYIFCEVMDINPVEFLN